MEFAFCQQGLDCNGGRAHVSRRGGGFICAQRCMCCVGPRWSHAQRSWVCAHVWVVAGVSVCGCRCTERGCRDAGWQYWQHVCMGGLCCCSSRLMESVRVLGVGCCCTNSSGKQRVWCLGWGQAHKSTPEC